jgi:hypothetical protein
MYRAAARQGPSGGLGFLRPQGQGGWATAAAATSAPPHTSTFKDLLAATAATTSISMLSAVIHAPGTSLGLGLPPLSLPR